MKKVFPHILTSLITIVVVFSGIFLYDIFNKKSCCVMSNSDYSNVNITEADTIKTSVKKVYDSVVLIETYSGQTISGTGTGFVYKKDDKNGYILTNYHVVENSKSIKVTFTDGKTYDTTLLGYDEYYDVAVLSVDANSVISVATIGSSEKAEVGDTVFTVGSPLGSSYMGTVTKGIISGKDRQVSVTINNSSYIMEVLQTDAAVNPGNSGGPLVNINGEVIGITFMKLVENQIEGMGFTIPIELVMSCTDTLEKGEKIERPYLGVETSSIDNRFYLRRYNINIPDEVTFGAVIVNVVSNSPASNAGLKSGDVIVTIDDVEITDSTYLKYNLYKHKIGDKVKVKYYRDGKINETVVTLSKLDS